MKLDKSYNFDVKLMERMIIQDATKDLDFESMFFFASFRRAAPVTLCTSTFQAFATEYNKELAGTKKVLQWLGLAKHDDDAPLGWRATSQFMYLLVLLPGPYDTLDPPDWPERSTLEETLFLAEMQESAIGKSPDEATECFVNRVLAQFNLVAMDGPDNMFIVGEYLKRLVKNARKRQRTRK
jgi:hypothetical protein